MSDAGSAESILAGGLDGGVVAGDDGEEEGGGRRVAVHGVDGVGDVLLRGGGKTLCRSGLVCERADAVALGEGHGGDSEAAQHGSLRRLIGQVGDWVGLLQLDGDGEDGAGAQGVAAAEHVHHHGQARGQPREGVDCGKVAVAFGVAVDFVNSQCGSDLAVRELLRQGLRQARQGHEHTEGDAHGYRS